jgi:hypothetical protein
MGTRFSAPMGNGHSEALGRSKGHGENLEHLDSVRPSRPTAFEALGHTRAGDCGRLQVNPTQRPWAQKTAASKLEAGRSKRGKFGGFGIGLGLGCRKVRSGLWGAPRPSRENPLKRTWRKKNLGREDPASRPSQPEGRIVEARKSSRPWGGWSDSSSGEERTGGCWGFG